MAGKIIIKGLRSPMLVTLGYGDPSVIPPPTPPVGGDPGVILGNTVGGDVASSVNTPLGIEVY